jgi:hypothetical protein
MSPQAWSAIIAGLAVAGQIANVILNLKLRNAILESEQRVLGEVEEKYRTKEMCDAQMQNLNDRLGFCPVIAEGKRHAA